MFKRDLFFILFLIINSLLFAQSAEITIDGVFDDWSAGLTTFTDANETINGVDLLEVKVTNDADFLFIKIKTNTEFDLTDNTTPQDIGLYIDTDNNATTGYAIQAGYGSEIGLLFNQYLVHYNVSSYSQLSFSDFSLRIAPTVSSDEFEIAIKRSAIPDGTNPLFPSNTIKILVRNGENSDQLPNNGMVLSYTFDDTGITPLVPTNINKENTNLIRIVSYNTEFDGLINMDRSSYFESIVTSLNPDIISFLESWNTTASEIKTLMDIWIPLGTTDGWYVIKKSSAIIASKWNFSQSWYHLDRQFPVLIDLPNTYTTDLLFTAAHLKCCDNGDALRQDQADQYAAFILDAKTAGGQVTIPQNTPFIYAGDLNLVGSSNPLTTLVTGNIQNITAYGNGGFLDWDNTTLTDENAIQTDVRMAYTWRKDDTQYPPGKLDFFIYSDAVLNVQKSFVLQTEVMSNNRLQLYDLNYTDTASASDHFPVTVDFQLSTVANLASYNFDASIHIYPNPTTNNVTINFDELATYRLRLFDVFGKEISVQQTTESTTIVMRGLVAGIYFVSINDEKGNTTWRKIIKI